MSSSSRTTAAVDHDEAAPAARRRRPSLGTVLGGAALFVALGGTSYAAATLPAKSVGAAQLRTSAVTSKKLAANAVTSAKVKDGSLVLKDFKAGQLPAGGGAGPAGPKGDPGAKGEKGEKGDVGPAGPLLDALPSGRTLTGQFAVAGHKTANGDFVSETAVSFPLPLGAAPSAEVVTSTPTTNCAGTVDAPTAAPGVLCLYADHTSGGSGLAPNTSRHGASIFVSGLAAGANYEWDGSWAVTAP